MTDITPEIVTPNFSEHDLCTEFISLLEGTEFRVFPEYQDWDIVLTRGNIRIGIQAKLKMNAKALAQTIRAGGVDFKIILTKSYPIKLKAKDDWLAICNALNILIISKSNNIKGMPFLLVNSYWEYNREKRLGWLFDWRHSNPKPLVIPDFDYETKAGVPSPHKVTERNVNLVKLEMYARSRPGGFVSLKEIRSFGFYRVPRMYFYYTLSNRMWHLQAHPKFWPSTDYPHIAAGLQERRKLD